MGMLIKQGLLMNDPWSLIEQPLDNYRDYPWFSIVPLEGLGDKAQWPLAQTWIGAWFGVEIDTQRITPQFLSLPLLNIHIESYSDGRAFSLARQLRSSLKFEGELRLSGNFLLDQMAHLQDCGVNSFSLPDDSDFEHALFILKHSPKRTF